MAEFAASVDAWLAKVEGALEAVFKTATQSLIAEMQRPGPSKATAKIAIAQGAGLKGRGKIAARMGPIPNPGGSGNLPVDTGFLRSSLRVNLSEMPSLIEDARGEEGKTYDYDAGTTSLVINGAKLGDTIYAGYTAAYARRIHYEQRQWVTLAAQNWQQHVNDAVAEVKAELGL